MADTGQQPVEPEKQVPPPTVQPDGTVKTFDDPKIRAVLQTWLAPIIAALLLKLLKTTLPDELTNALSGWVVSFLLAALAGAAVAARAIYRRVLAGKDPNNPAKPIAAPTIGSAANLLK